MVSIVGIQLAHLIAQVFPDQSASPIAGQQLASKISSPPAINVTPATCKQREPFPAIQSEQARLKQKWLIGKHPHSWNLLVYYTQLKRLAASKGLSVDSDYLWIQVVEDLWCIFPQPLARQWVALVPGTIREAQWTKAQSQWADAFLQRKTHPTFDEFKEYVTQLRRRAKEFGVSLDLTEEIFSRWRGILSEKELEKLESLFVSPDEEKERIALRLSRAQLQLESKKYPEASSLIKQGLTHPSPSIRFIAETLQFRLAMLDHGLAPDFSARISDGDSKGQQFHLKEQKGKIVVLEFWQSWCGPCRKRLEILEKIYREFGEKRIIVVGISNVHLEENKSAIQKVYQEVGISFPQIIENGELTDLYQVGLYPHLLVIDSQGNVAYYRPGEDVNLTVFIRQLLGGKK